MCNFCGTPPAALLTEKLGLVNYLAADDPEDWATSSRRAASTRSAVESTRLRCESCGSPRLRLSRMSLQPLARRSEPQWRAGASFRRERSRHPERRLTTCTAWRSQCAPLQVTSSLIELAMNQSAVRQAMRELTIIVGTPRPTTAPGPMAAPGPVALRLIIRIMNSATREKLPDMNAMVPATTVLDPGFMEGLRATSVMAIRVISAIRSDMSTGLDARLGHTSRYPKISTDAVTADRAAVRGLLNIFLVLGSSGT